MNKIYTLLFLCFLSLNCIGQELILSKGEKTKTFRESSIFTVISHQEHTLKDIGCPGFTTLIGKLSSISEDSLNFQLTSYSRESKVENMKIDNSFYSSTGTMEASLARYEIFYLKNFKSYKSKRRKKGMNALGGMLLFTGVATALGALTVKGKSNQNNLLISGGLQLGLSFGFLIAAKSKKYYLDNSEKAWKVKQ